MTTLRVVAMDGNSKTTLHHRRDGYSALGEYYPAIDVEMTIDSTDADVYSMVDYFKRFLISAGYYEESFIEACYRITEEHELSEKAKEQKTGGYHRHRMGETGIDSNNFTFNIGDYDSQEDY